MKACSSIDTRGLLRLNCRCTKNQVKAEKNSKPCITWNDLLWIEYTVNCMQLGNPSIDYVLLTEPLFYRSDSNWISPMHFIAALRSKPQMA
jgi:hypothetical protein